MNMYEMVKHDIAQDYYAQNYDNDGQRFVAWYLRNIYGLDPAEAKDCITDGADDKQIDAVYIDYDEQKIYIIQGKFMQKAKSDSAPLKEIYSAWTQIKDLAGLQENANSKLAGKISEISSALNDGCELCFELVMTSELTKAAAKDAERYRQEMSDNEDLNAALSVIDTHGLENRYAQAVGGNGADITHDFALEPGMFMQVEIAGKKAVIAVISLLDCLNIPGIQDGSLFRRNVRQSLGDKVKVNKEIARSLKDNPGEFFFLHNGITATCSSLKIEGSTLHAEGLSVVNGCQSLTTIFGCSESVKKSGAGYIVFRFYEVNGTDDTEAISRSTNSQNAVKPRDLCSNDKYVLAMKKAYEHCYPDGQFITKRGEKAGSDKKNAYVVELGTLGKMLITWHMQRPTVTHEEVEIFSSNFKLLFHRKYDPEDIQALNELFSAITETWKAKNGNPLGFNEELFKHKAYAPYWHLLAVSMLLCEVNKQQTVSVPVPSSAMKVIHGSNILEEVVERAGNCVNEAFLASIEDAEEQDIVFNVPNWFKSGRTITVLQAAVRKSLKAYNPEDKKKTAEFREKLSMSKRDFGPRWEKE